MDGSRGKMCEVSFQRILVKKVCFFLKMSVWRRGS